ncbi:MAG: hypothetical protein D6705_12985 [Deltaproteobacteria bacterium]|nr:MAG: hypothetical protein D6705_12985 [Deltaproteobacteria bacterium]
MPVRALLAVPIACAVIGGLELAALAPRLGFGPARWVHGVLGVALAGTWPAILLGLVAVLLARLGRSADRFFGAFLRPHWAAGFALAWFAVEAAARLVPWAVAALDEHTLDFAEVSVQIWSFTAACVLAAVVPAGIFVGDRMARRLSPTRARWLARICAGAIALRVLDLARGRAFVLKFGDLLAPASIAGAAFVAALWLPSRIRATRMRLAACAGAFAALVVGGVSAHRSPATRAAMLHESRILPDVVRLGLGFLDGDADGALPTWIGGNDCDDADPTVGGHRPELPGNGIDDNCHGGDAPPWREDERGPRPTGPRPHVVLVTIDALAARALADFGAPFDTMPNLEARARRGRWYLRAYAPANRTFFSLVAMLSGQRPERLVLGPTTQNVRFTFWLPHRMQQLGYRTVAIEPPLLGDHLPFSELRFEELYVGPWDYDARNRGGTARQRVDLVDHLFDDGPPDRPLFLWVHLYDAHALHEAHERFPGVGTENSYFEELFWIDLQLARLFSILDEHLGDDKILIVTSDHGETFGERGAYGHGHGLHEPEIHVPLLFEGPGIAPTRVAEPYPVGGIVPAILERLGQPAEPTMLSYPSVLGPPPALVVVENPFSGDERRLDVTAIAGDAKWYGCRACATWVYTDLSTDPDERLGLATEPPPSADAVRMAALDVLERARPVRTPP